MSTTWHREHAKQEAAREEISNDRLRNILIYLNGLQPCAEREALLKELRDSYGIDYEKIYNEAHSAEMSIKCTTPGANAKEIISYAPFESMTLERAVEILNERKHNLFDDWRPIDSPSIQAVVAGGDYEDEDAYLTEWEAIACAEKYEREAAKRKSIRDEGFIEEVIEDCRTIIADGKRGGDLWNK